MQTKHPISLIVRKLNLFHLSGIASLLLIATASHAQGETDFLYYSNSFEYDAISGNWFDGSWDSCEPPEDPGALTGGEEWDHFTVGDQEYAYDWIQTVWYTSSDGGDTWGPGSEPSIPHTYLYYSYLYAYDELSGNWYDETLHDPDFTDGTWGVVGGGVADPGLLTGGDDWTFSTVGDDDYAYDSLSGWYIYNSDTGGWDSSSDPNS